MGIATIGPASANLPGTPHNIVDFVSTYGADPTGGQKSTTAFANALQDSRFGSFGRTLIVPPGLYEIDDQIDVDMSHLNGLTIIGYGPYVSRIKFTPAAHDKIAFNIVDSGNTISGIHIEGIYLFTTDTTYRKKGLYLSDMKRSSLRNCVISGFNDSSDLSIGVETLGREQFTMDTCVIDNADSPLKMSKNPQSNISADSFYFQNVQFICPTTKTGINCVTLADTAIPYEVCFQNCNFIRGSYGFYHSGPNNAVGTGRISFRSCRREQSTDSAGYSVYHHPLSTQNYNQAIMFDGFGFDATQNGFDIADVQSVTVKDSTYTGTGTVFTVSDIRTLRIDNSFLGATGASISPALMSGYKTEYADEKVFSTHAVPQNAVYTNLTYNTGIPALADDATPSIFGSNIWRTGGTTAITDFDDGVEGQIITIIAQHSVTITDNTNLLLAGGNFAMTNTDTLMLVQKSDGKWHEISRSDNG